MISGGDRANEKKKLRAKVTFSYSPQNEDEMKLEVGDIVEILKQVCFSEQRSEGLFVMYSAFSTFPTSLMFGNLTSDILYHLPGGGRLVGGHCERSEGSFPF